MMFWGFIWSFPFFVGELPTGLLLR
jgi:hypothetical protein